MSNDLALQILQAVKQQLIKQQAASYYQNGNSNPSLWSNSNNFNVPSYDTFYTCAVPDFVSSFRYPTEPYHNYQNLPQTNNIDPRQQIIDYYYQQYQQSLQNQGANQTANENTIGQNTTAKTTIIKDDNQNLNEEIINKQTPTTKFMDLKEFTEKTGKLEKEKAQLTAEFEKVLGREYLAGRKITEWTTDGAGHVQKETGQYSLKATWQGLMKKYDLNADEARLVLAKLIAKDENMDGRLSKAEVANYKNLSADKQNVRLQIAKNMTEEIGYTSRYDSFSSRFKNLDINKLDTDQISDKNPVKANVESIKAKYKANQSQLNGLKGEKYIDMDMLKQHKGELTAEGAGAIYKDLYATYNKLDKADQLDKGSELYKKETALKLADELSDNTFSGVSKDEFLAAKIAQDYNKDGFVSAYETSIFNSESAMEQASKVMDAFNFMRNHK